MRMTSTNRFSAYLIIGLASVIGGGSLLLFMLFLFLNSLHFVKLNLSHSARLWLNAGLCLLFFAQHSGMIRRAFRRSFTRIVSPDYHGAVYSVASGAALLLLVFLWQDSSRMLLDIQGMFRWLVRGIYFLAIAGMVWGMTALGSFDTFGMAPILLRLRDKQLKPIPFTVRGPYRWVRHPLYFFMLLLIWSSPDVTADRLLFNLLFTAWITVGTLLEEKDLVSDFGLAYRNYQQNVPMLVPYRLLSSQITETCDKVRVAVSPGNEA